MMMLGILGTAFIAIVVALALIGVLNWFAQQFLRRRADILASPEDRNTQMNRKIREELVPIDKRTIWYDIKAPDEQFAMWNEFYLGGNVFESYTHFRPRAFEGKYLGVTEA